MSIRIVVADQANAQLYEIEHRHQLQDNVPLRAVGELSDPAAHLHDRDFRSDRPGRSFDRAPLRGNRRGATAHHGMGAERQARTHESERFARQIAETLLVADQGRHINQLVLIAAPRFLGALRAALSDSLRQRVTTEIHRDLTHAPERALREHLLAELSAGRL